MSAFGKHGRRCDICGKIANNRMGEYVRKDGTQGYIWLDLETSKHVCDDCDEKKRKLANNG